MQIDINNNNTINGIFAISETLYGMKSNMQILQIEI